MVKSGQVVAGITVSRDATGALAAPSVGPAGVLYVNGVANGATVTVSGANPYKWSVTLPTLTAGDIVQMYITATVSTIATGAVVWQDVADTKRVSDLVDAAAPPSAADVADAVLDEAKGAHAGLLAGVALDSTVAKEATLTHATYGLDKIKTDTAAILVDTGTDGVKLADSALTDAKMDTTVLQAFRDAMKRAATSGTPTTGSIDKHLDDILADTAEIGTAGAGLTNIPYTGPSVVDVDTRLSLTHGANAWGASVGAFSKVYTVTVGGVATAGAYCRLCTDAACTVSVSAGTTNSLGQVTFWHNLPVGTAVWVHVVLDDHEPKIDPETV